MTKQIVIDANGARIPALGFGTWQLRGAACVAAVERPTPRARRIVPV